MNTSENKLHILLKLYVPVDIYKHFWLTDEKLQLNKRTEKCQFMTKVHLKKL